MRPLPEATPAPLLLTGPVDHDHLLGARAACQFAQRRTALLATSQGGLGDVRVEALDEVPPGSVRLVVSSGVLCAVEHLADVCGALARCLAPDGELRFLEHVDRVRWPGLVQRAADPLWSRYAGGCHVDRDVPAELRQAGLFIPDLERFTMPTLMPVLRPWVQGRAVHPLAQPR